MSSGLLPLAVSLGDPAGIGPEIITESWAQRSASNLVPFFVVGGLDVLRAAAEARGVNCPLIAIGDPEEAVEAFPQALPVLAGADCDYRPAQPDEQGAALALHSLAESTRMALLGKSSGVVTAPVAKSQLAKIGFEFPGQTEFLAAVSGMAPHDAVMMLAGPTLRTVPITVHIALGDVPSALSRELIIHKARIVADGLAKDFGIVDPHLAIAGLNPHAGEDGKFGDEESRLITPAITQLRDEGIDASGPHPGDALFMPRTRAGYDAALCMYHDQALIPIKAIEFDEGVNVTLGLPIVRTSPDHGTAFDIAGHKMADPSAMIAALRMAADCARNRSGQAINA